MPRSSGCGRPSSCSPRISTRRAWLASLAGTRRRPPWHFDPGTGKRLLCEQLGTLDLAGFDAEDAWPGVGAAGCLLQYAKDTQRAAPAAPAHADARAARAGRDSRRATRRNLEIETSLGARAGVHARRPARPVRDGDGQPAPAPLVESADPRPRGAQARQQAIDVLQRAGPVEALQGLLKDDRRPRAHSDAHRLALGAAARSRAAARQRSRDCRRCAACAAPLAAARLRSSPRVAASTPTSSALLKRALVETPPRAAARRRRHRAGLRRRARRAAAHQHATPTSTRRLEARERARPASRT